MPIQAREYTKEGYGPPHEILHRRFRRTRLRLGLSFPRFSGHRIWIASEGEVVFCAACGQQLRAPTGATRIHCSKCQHQQTVSSSAKTQDDAGAPNCCSQAGGAPMRLLSGLFGVVAAICSLGALPLWLYVRWLVHPTKFLQYA